jgi:hypothetical protein
MIFKRELAGKQSDELVQQGLGPSWILATDKPVVAAEAVIVVISINHPCDPPHRFGGSDGMRPKLMSASFRRASEIDKITLVILNTQMLFTPHEVKP